MPFPNQMVTIVLVVIALLWVMVLRYMKSRKK